MALPGGEVSAVDAVQLVKSGIQDLVFAGFAVVFLVTAEDRRKRRRALGFLRELRAVAHIVDKHQLTKDPDQLIDAVRSTDSSPERTLTRDELAESFRSCCPFPVSDRLFQSIWGLLDHNQDGRVDLDEFVNVFNKLENFSAKLVDVCL